MNIDLNSSIKILELDILIEEKLFQKSIYSINDLWGYNRKELKRLDLTDNEINRIIIKLELNGISLNKKINSNDMIKR